MSKKRADSDSLSITIKNVRDRSAMKDLNNAIKKLNAARLHLQRDELNEEIGRLFDIHQNLRSFTLNEDVIEKPLADGARELRSVEIEDVKLMNHDDDSDNEASDLSETISEELFCMVDEIYTDHGINGATNGKYTIDSPSVIKYSARARAYQANKTLEKAALIGGNKFPGKTARQRK